MSKILFYLGVIMIIAWAIAFFGFHKSGIIHVLPAIAILTLFIRLLYNKSLMQ